MQSKVKWNSQMSFLCDNRGLPSQFDTVAEHGGNNSAPSPKEGVLNAMCACSGMDVVSIAKKMHLTLNNFVMEAEAQTTNTTPSYFAKVHVKYFLTGDPEPEKFIKAVVLSMTKYCGVSFMISKVCPITYEIHLNQQLIYEDQARFELEIIENG
jgi:putative redox protein